MRDSYKQLRNGDYGVTITWEHRASGELHTAHTKGEPRLVALRNALDGWDAAEWRIVCISTPQTIYDDLIGRRALIERPVDYWGDHAELSPEFDRLTRTPERGLLSKVPGGMAYLAVDVRRPVS